jgi:hypothetical protein
VPVLEANDSPELVPTVSPPEKVSAPVLKHETFKVTLFARVIGPVNVRVAAAPVVKV